MQKIFAVFACVFANFALYFTASAYTFLQPLPGLESSQPGFEGPLQGGLFTTYLSWLFKFMLAAAAFLAVAQIVVAGIQKIIGGASETARSDATKRIQDAIYGLLLALASWLILYTINPDLAGMKLTIPEIKIGVTPPAAGACNGCVLLSSQKEILFDVKPSACAGGSQNCQLQPLLISRINLLSYNAEQLGLPRSNWQVTEGWPPTISHLDSCHNNGYCVDIALTGGVTKGKVSELLESARKAGLKVVCEYDQFPELGCKKYPTTNAPNIHIEN